MTARPLARAALILTLLLTACATPVGVRPINAKTAYRQLTESALSGNRPSIYSSQVLARLSMREEFEKSPTTVLATLRAGLGGTHEVDRLFALAELSYLHARRTQNPQYFLAAALYAYAFLFPQDQARNPSPYDPRLRLAMDLYNRATVAALRAAPKSHTIDLTTRPLTLPFAPLSFSSNSAAFKYAGYRLKSFVSLENFEVYGFRNHYRKAGIGAPLSASVEAIPGQTASKWIPPRAKFPLTAFLRFEDVHKALSSDQEVNGRIELYDADATPAVTVNGHTVPLESDPSTALAYRLNNSPLWDFEIAGFRRGDFALFGQQPEGTLYFLTPYRPGRIPVVFVHGTASSPARWGEMSNELLSDPNIASRYQLWFFLYNSGNPIALSAMHLRESLQAALKDIDPQGKDPALRNMVVIGHSQGGLLTKLTAVSSGNQFWEIASKESFDQAKLTPDIKDLMRRSMFVEPLPFVRNLIFIATPHQGSYVAENWIGQLGRRFITLPAVLSKTAMEVIALRPTDAIHTALRVPTAIDNMNSANPFLHTLSTLPIAPGVQTHSIIAVKNKGPLAKGRDGVVAYTSAHIEGVQSELVVRSGHSCQANPHTIEEVRRILSEYARTVDTNPTSAISGR